MRYLGLLLFAVAALFSLLLSAGTPLETRNTSNGNAGVVAGVAAAAIAGVIALGGAAWFARSRWLR